MNVIETYILSSSHIFILQSPEQLANMLELNLLNTIR